VVAVDVPLTVIDVLPITLRKVVETVAVNETVDVTVPPLLFTTAVMLLSDATFDLAMTLVRRLGKQPVVARDSSGFVVNRLLIPYMLDAIRALENGVGTITDIDAGMQLGAGHPMGPFTLLDFVGLDTVERVAEVMFDEYREQRFAPPPLLRRLVRAGHLGRKAGRGFYDHTLDPPVPSPLAL